MTRPKLFLIICIFALMGVSCQPKNTDESLTDIVGASIEDRDPYWIRLQHPTTDADGAPLAVGQIVDLAGKTPAPICNLLQFPDETVRNERPFESHGETSSSFGGFVSLLRGVLPNAGGSARAGFSNIRRYSITWGDLETVYLDWVPKEGTIQEQFDRRCASFVMQHRVQETELYPRLHVVVGTVTSDSLIASFELNPDAATNSVNPEDSETDANDGNDESQSSDEGDGKDSSAIEGIVSDSKIDEVSVADETHDISTPSPACGFEGSASAYLSEKIGVGGSRKVCRSGQSELTFQTPYTVGLRLFTIDDFKEFSLTADTELDPGQGTVRGHLVSQTDYDALPPDSGADD